MNSYFTVGPSQLYPTVRKHIHSALTHNIPSISHRSEDFQQLFFQSTHHLKKLLSIPAEYSVFFTSSGTEAMERILQNCVDKTSVHFVNGAFSDRFFQTAQELRKNPIKIEAEYGKGFDAVQYTIPDTELICVTQNETSTGVAIPPEDIYTIADEHPNSLISVDIVSSAPYVDLNYHKLDCVFFSVQKGFGLPAGLGVMIVSPRALEKSKYLENKGQVTGTYHSFSQLEKYAKENQTPETPNVLAIYLFSKVLDDMLKISIGTIRESTDDKAERLYTFFKHNQDFTLLVKDGHYQSKTTIVIGVNKGSKNIIEYLKCLNIHVSSGYKDLKNTHIRIANFPTHSAKQIELLLHSLELATAK